MPELDRNPNLTTKVGVRFLNVGWQDKIRRALQMVKIGHVRDSIANAFFILIPNHADLTHAELAEVLDRIAEGKYTLEDALEARRASKKRPHGNKQAALSCLKALKQELLSS